jgi:hypothetical protein
MSLTSQRLVAVFVALTLTVALWSFDAVPAVAAVAVGGLTYLLVRYWLWLRSKRTRSIS